MTCACTSAWAPPPRWNRCRFAGRMVMLSHCRMLLATTFIPSLKERGFRTESRYLLYLRYMLRCTALVKRVRNFFDAVIGSLGHSAENPTFSVRKRAISVTGLLKRVSATLTAAAALAVFFPRASEAANDPVRALQALFQAAKDSLAAGDLA